MTLRRVTRLLSPCSSETQPACFLPFLYQTRTLVAGQSASPAYTSQLEVGQTRRISSSAEASKVHYRPLKNANAWKHEPDVLSRRGSPNSHGDASGEGKKLQWSTSPRKAPRDPETKYKAARRSSNMPQAPLMGEEKPRNSTITASEKAVFDCIFGDLSKAPPKKEQTEEADEEKLDNLEEHSVEEEDLPGDPRDQLTAIFEFAISKVNERETSSSEGESEKVAHLKGGSYVRAAALSSDSLGRATFAQSSEVKRVEVQTERHSEGEESEAVLKRASDDHKQLVDSQLEAATTDVEIWNVLEKEVFSLVTRLSQQIKVEEKARKAETRRQRKAAKASESVEVLLEASEKHRSVATQKKSYPLTSTDFKTPTINTLLSILQANYAHHCLHALRLFRNRRIPSPYALHLLPHLKSLGPISYVLGASPGLYNEILYQKWTQFSDVQGMADLMEEMVNQGISANVTTLELLRFVDRSRQRDLIGANGGAKSTWWSLRAVKEGWARVKALYERFKAELGETGRWDMQALREERMRMFRTRQGARTELVRKTHPMTVRRVVEKQARPVERGGWASRQGAADARSQPRDYLLPQRLGPAIGGSKLKDGE